MQVVQHTRGTGTAKLGHFTRGPLHDHKSSPTRAPHDCLVSLPSTQQEQSKDGRYIFDSGASLHLMGVN